MIIYCNGKKCQVPDGATVADLRKVLGHELHADQIVRQEKDESTLLNESDLLKERDHIYSIPKIVKGAKDRIEQEVDLLRKDAGQRSQVVIGNKTIGDKRFRAVLIKNVSVPAKRFGVTRTDLLFLLPPEYPKIPPIGFYLNYKWSTTDRHFILRAAHGAPSLENEGWYWYCGALMNSSGSRTWKPGTKADNGHNLITLFAAAKHHLRNDEE
jgi:hypothetical protein